MIGKMVQWKNYNGALLLQGRPPHSNNDDVTIAEAKQALANEGGYFCRWTTDFDCDGKTSWWYCIKDEPIEIEKLTSKQRYRVNKGLKNWDIVKITSEEIDSFLLDMFDVAIDCFSEYPSKYRPKLNYLQYCEENKRNIVSNDYWLLLDKVNHKVHGYAICGVSCDYVSLYVVKVRPSVLKLEPNAAIGYQLCFYYLNYLKLRYICDGERNIRHETNYQEFLCRVLDFRYAYCHLNLVYSNRIAVILPLLRPFWHFFEWGGHFSKFLYNIFSLIKLDKISRSIQ